MKVLVPQRIDKAGTEYLQAKGYEIKQGSGFDPATIIREIADCQGLICRTYPVTGEIIRAGKNLKVISRHGVGVDLIDVQAATNCRIQVTNAPFSNTEAVAEHIIALALACAKQIPALDLSVRNLQWEERRNSAHLTELGGKVLGIVGLGKIGRSLAKKCALGFGMKVVAYVRRQENLPDYIQPVSSIKDVFSLANIVSLSLPSNRETVNSIGLEHFSLMPQEGIFINCARGDIVREEDLYQALTGGMIRAAGLDVLALEPPSSENKLLKLPNVVFTPHTAALTVESLANMSLQAAMGIHEVLSNQPVSWPVNSLPGGVYK